MNFLTVYCATLSPMLPEILVFLFLTIQIIYLVFFSNHLFFNYLNLGTLANSLTVCFLLGLCINFFSSADPFFQSFNWNLNLTCSSTFARAFLFFFSALTLLVSTDYLASKNIRQYEYSLLILFSVAGLSVLNLSTDFLSIFVALELQGLAFYLLATFYWNSNFSAESGLKYFVLGSFSSCILLFGFSVIYSITGSTTFEVIQALTIVKTYNFDFLMFGFIFSFTAFLFKVGVVPFHMWLCDVYEGAISPVTMFFALIPKIIIFYVLLKILFCVFASEYVVWSFFCQIFGLLSIFFASIAGIFQKKLKRLMAFSTISHSGFILVGISCFTFLSLKATSFYLIVYVFMNMAVFSVILGSTFHSYFLKYLINWSYFYHRNFILAMTFSFLLLALAGIPPLLGFFSKLMVILTLIDQSEIVLALLTVTFSCIACYYYIRLIKIFFFSVNEKGVWVSMQPRAIELSIATFTTLVSILLAFPDVIMNVTNVFATFFV